MNSHEGTLVRVAYVLWEYPCASEQFIAREIEALRELGVAIEVFVIGPRVDSSDSTPTNVPVHRRPGWLGGLRALLHPLGFVRRARTAWRLPASRRAASRIRALELALSVEAFRAQLERANPDLLHAHFATLPTTFAALAADLLDRPFGFSTHARDVYAADIDFGSRVQLARYVLACSDVARRDVEARIAPQLRERVRLVYHGLDVDSWQAPLESAPTERGTRILAVGRFEPKKGFDVLLDACARLSAQGRDFECRLVGKGALESELAAAIEARRLSQRVTLVPWQTPEELRRSYAWADVLAVPCVVAADGDRDNIPNVVLEAMALGLRVVASDLPALREALDDGAAGRLVPSGDADALAAELVSDEPDEALRSAARARIERCFDNRRNVRELAHLFQSLVRPASSR